MDFLELPHKELEMPFGLRFLYQSYLNLRKKTLKPDNLILLFKKDFLELQSAIKQERDAHKIALMEQKKLFDSQISLIQDEFKTLLEQSAIQIIPIPEDVKRNLNVKNRP